MACRCAPTLTPLSPKRSVSRPDPSNGSAPNGVRDCRWFSCRPWRASVRAWSLPTWLLAIAEGGTRVLVVDADAGDGGLAARLLLGTPADDGGLEQVLAGQQPLANCIQPSPLNGAVAVLGSGPALHRRVTGAARRRRRLRCSPRRSQASTSC